jgi:hypothetical protein
MMKSTKTFSDTVFDFEDVRNATHSRLTATLERDGGAAKAEADPSFHFESCLRDDCSRPRRLLRATNIQMFIVKSGRGKRGCPVPLKITSGTPHVRALRSSDSYLYKLNVGVVERSATCTSALITSYTRHIYWTRIRNR